MTYSGLADTCKHCGVHGEAYPVVEQRGTMRWPINSTEVEDGEAFVYYNEGDGELEPDMYSDQVIVCNRCHEPWQQDDTLWNLTIEPE